MASPSHARILLAVCVRDGPPMQVWPVPATQSGHTIENPPAATALQWNPQTETRKFPVLPTSLPSIPPTSGNRAVAVSAALAGS